MIYKVIYKMQIFKTNRKTEKNNNNKGNHAIHVHMDITYKRMQLQGDIRLILL